MAFLAAIPIATLLAGTAAVGAVGAGLISANESRNAGIAANQQAQSQARLEGDAAKGREIQRRQDLLRALASQNAAAGAAGVETSGSIGGIMRTNIKQNQQDLLTDAAGAGARRVALLAQGSNAQRSGNAQAFGTLLDTASKGASLYTPSAPPEQLSEYTLKTPRI